MDQEIELKPGIAAGDAGKIIASGLFPGRRISVRQKSIYFDTAYSSCFRCCQQP
jgi:hypothetical protein